MNIKPSFYSLLTGLICLSLVTVAVAQQERPPEGQDGPVIIRPNDNRLPRRSFTVPQDREPSQDQAILINSRYAGWQSATGALSGSRVGEEIRGNWIMVDETGRFEGNVVAGKGANVENLNVFLMHMGRLVNQTSLNADGRFEFTNVRQGAYSLIGWGDQGFFAFGFNILGYDETGASKIPNSLQITAFQNKTSINTDWIRYYSSRVSYRVYGRYQDGEGRNDPASLYGFSGLVSNLPDSFPATSISSHRVNKTEDGRLIGRVHQLNSISGRPVDVRTTQVLLLEGDSVVASTTTDNYGVFEFQEVPDGSYGVVAAGVDGLGLIAITVGQGDATMNDVGEFAGEEKDSIDFTMVSSETIGWLNHYAEEVAYRRALLAPRPPRVDNSNQFAGYGACPGCGNQAGGCATCQQAYAGCTCRSRGVSFEQWQQNNCQCEELAKIGDGRIIAAATKGIRSSVNRANGTFERAFYPSEFQGGAGGAQQYGGYGAPGYQNFQGGY